MRAFRLKDMIVSPMGLGETITVWIPIREWHKVFRGSWEGTKDGMFYKVIEIAEPEVKIQILKYDFRE